MRQFAFGGDRRGLLVVRQGNRHEVAWVAALTICVAMQAERLSAAHRDMRTQQYGRLGYIRYVVVPRPLGNLGRRASSRILGPARARRDQASTPTEARKIEDVSSKNGEAEEMV